MAPQQREHSREHLTDEPVSPGAHRAQLGNNDEAEQAAAQAEIAAALQEIKLKVAELREYAGHAAAVQLDRLKLIVGDLLGLLTAWVVAALVIAGVLVTCAVLVFLGLAALISAALEPHVWAGPLIAGVLGLTMIAAVTVLGVGWGRQKFRNMLVRKYEARRAEQRARFGRDADDAEAAAAAKHS